MDQLAMLGIVATALSTVAGILYKQMQDRIKRAEDRGDRHDVLLNTMATTQEAIKVILTDIRSDIRGK